MVTCIALCSSRRRVGYHTYGILCNVATMMIHMGLWVWCYYNCVDHVRYVSPFGRFGNQRNVTYYVAAPVRLHAR